MVNRLVVVVFLVLTIWTDFRQRKIIKIKLLIIHDWKRKTTQVIIQCII